MATSAKRPGDVEAWTERGHAVGRAAGVVAMIEGQGRIAAVPVAVVRALMRSKPSLATHLVFRDVANRFEEGWVDTGGGAQHVIFEIEILGGVVAYALILSAGTGHSVSEKDVRDALDALRALRVKYDDGSVWHGLLTWSEDRMDVPYCLRITPAPGVFTRNGGEAQQ